MEGGFVRWAPEYSTDSKAETQPVPLMPGSRRHEPREYSLLLSLLLHLVEKYGHPQISGLPIIVPATHRELTVYICIPSSRKRDLGARSLD